MTAGDPIQDCENRVAQMRQNISDLQSRRDELLRRIEGLKRAIGELEGRGPQFRLRTLELQAEIGAIEKELRVNADELRLFRAQLHPKEQECWELRRNRGRNSPSEDELRKTIDDPRYWRDGDPALTSFVSEGFKQLYPDDPEG
jgi:chromosome segregation ATPase